MTRSTRYAGYVNQISFEDLQEVLGSNFEDALKFGLSQLFSEFGLRLAEAIIEGEVQSLCGPKHSRKNEDQMVRWGKQKGTIKLRGAKENISKPRVRTADGKDEIDLETYSALNSETVLNEELLARVSSGVSTRQYEKTISKQLKKHGVSKSAISRRVIAESQKALDVFKERRWDKSHFVAILFDGVRFGKALVVAAVGIDKSGHKHILGWQIGSTENETVCRDLIRKLIDAGLDVNNQYLFVLDGGKGLRNAIKLVFGVHSIVQRCVEHKIRDVEGYLPRKFRLRFRLKIQAALNQNTFKKASDRLQKIRRELVSISEPAANSFTEGLEELLTLHKLGINGAVRESLRTTNIIESAFSRLRNKTKNVSNWTDSQQIDRWLGFTLPQVERGFQQLPGYRQLAKLGRAVNKLQTALQNPKS